MPAQNRLELGDALTQRHRRSYVGEVIEQVVDVAVL